MGKLKQTSTDVFGKYHYIMGPVVAALMGTLGYGEWEKRQDPAPAPSVSVVVESMPTVSLTDNVRSDLEIQVLINKALKDHLNSSAH